MPFRLLDGAAAAGAIALISATGGLGSALAAPIIGSLHDSRHDWTHALLFVAAWSLVTPLLLLLSRCRLVGVSPATAIPSPQPAAG